MNNTWICDCELRVRMQRYRTSWQKNVPQCEKCPSNDENSKNLQFETKMFLKATEQKEAKKLERIEQSNKSRKRTMKICINELELAINLRK